MGSVWVPSAMLEVSVHIFKVRDKPIVMQMVGIQARSHVVTVVLPFVRAHVSVNKPSLNIKIKLFEKILQEHTPLKKMRVREKDIPYMNPEWKRAIRKRRKYAQKYSKD